MEMLPGITSFKALQKKNAMSSDQQSIGRKLRSNTFAIYSKYDLALRAYTVHIYIYAWTSDVHHYTKWIWTFATNNK